MSDRLSDREQEVLRLISYGLENKEIADDLTISVHTVQTHITRAFGKLGARNRPHAIRRGFEEGYLSIDIKWAADWVTCPGETLEEWFQETKVPRSVAWKFYDIPENKLTELLAGREPLTPGIAARLEAMTQVTSIFWLRYEAIYRNGLAAGLSHSHGEE